MSTFIMKLIEFKLLLESWNLTLHVDFATHCTRNTLASIISRRDSGIISNITSSGFVSDYLCITAQLPSFKHHKVYSSPVIMVHKHKNINKKLLGQDLENSELLKFNSDSLTAITENFDTTLSKMIDMLL